MRLIKEKYKALKPTLDYLTDEVIIAQAWKKTHGYIRSFNWYADTLELDISALCIEENAKIWAQELEDNKSISKLELVPAAKSEHWTISKRGWQPSDARGNKIPLRPLAHIQIRDQTWATAVMMCLADAVETAQGDCSEPNFEKARSKGIYSYGNRLLCDWNKDGKAWFRWGNSEVYRKFFTDYQNFLKRPLVLGREVANVTAGNEEVFIVNLDLSKFYNTIDNELLIERLIKISNQFHNSEKPESQFWNRVRAVFGWKWREEDESRAKEIGFKQKDIALGLPQGLVSSGFFANAYLNEFDKEIGRRLGDELNAKSNIVLHDYCRYVDDIRLVVSAESDAASVVKETVNKFIDDKLKSFGGKKLELNFEKTKINVRSDLDNDGSMSNRVKLIQSDLSGPSDRDSIESISGILENLLSVEPETLGFLNDDIPDSPLLAIANFDHDVRPDTLKRFAANRLESIVKSKRKMTYEGDELEFRKSEAENELLAKKLIYAWMKDPSLGLVLRKALEIFPDEDLFEPVIEAVFARSSFSIESGKSDLVTAWMMDYLLADLFRCASDFNGYFQVVDYPSFLKPFSVIELLVKYAQKVIAADSRNHDFVVRQALMLLAVVNKPVLKNFEEDTIQVELHKILANSNLNFSAKRAALYEVAGQITGNFDTYAALLLEEITSESANDARDRLEVFAKRGGPFWLAIWRQLKKKKKTSITSFFKWAEPMSSSLPKPRKQILSKVISSELNGFKIEHGVLKLALGLLQLVDDKPDILESSPTGISVDIGGAKWNEIWQTNVDRVDCKPKVCKRDPRFAIPDWIDNEADSDKGVLYWIGCLLRAAVLGGADYTGTLWKEGKTTTYKGLRSNWYKRRMGMIHSPEALVGEFSTVSDWFSDLLMRCLQWPGFESTFVKSNDVNRIDSLESFRECLEGRLSKLNSLICGTSSLPAIPTEVKRPQSDDRGFRIVTVQQIVPKTTDFSASDVELNNPKIRAKHRAHLAAICRLTIRTLEAKRIADSENSDCSADLIVFPEVSVHIDDQDLIKRLADKTKAIVFAGLVFKDYQGKLVNIGRWFIPDYRESGRHWILRDQGKQHMTANEVALGISSFRPCQHILEIKGHTEGPFNISAAICYDATDINLAADLRDKTELFVVSAHNRDVTTFDNMASALQWHMYQHVVICNIGEFGGSTIQAPYKQQYDRLISHVHGVGQISINMADIDLAAFKRKVKKYKEVKAKPAGKRA